MTVKSSAVSSDVSIQLALPVDFILAIPAEKAENQATVAVSESDLTPFN
jgi:hypothetical protein